MSKNLSHCISEFQKNKIDTMIVLVNSNLAKRIFDDPDNKKSENPNQNITTSLLGLVEYAHYVNVKKISEISENTIKFTFISYGKQNEMEILRDEFVTGYRGSILAKIPEKLRDDLHLPISMISPKI